MAIWGGNSFFTTIGHTFVEPSNKTELFQWWKQEKWAQIICFEKYLLRTSHALKWLKLLNVTSGANIWSNIWVKCINKNGNYEGTIMRWFQGQALQSGHLGLNLKSTTDQLWGFGILPYNFLKSDVEIRLRFGEF